MSRSDRGGDTRYVSPVCSPLTRDSPSPATALTTTTFRSPDTGSALKATPAARAGIMGMMTTPGAAPVSRPRSRRYASTGPLRPLRHTAATFCGTSAAGTFRNEDSCPAKEWSSPSSSRALERTA